ncbi:MAG: hypothetical protein ACKVOU_05110 [Cytophagales bacterium]
MKKIVSAFSIIAFGVLLFSCTKEKEAIPAAQTVFTVYDSTNFKSNTTNETSLKGDFTSLVNEIKKARVSSYKLTENTLNTLYSSKLQAATTPYFKEQINLFIPEIAKSSTGGLYNYGIDTLGNGGVFGLGSSAYLFDEKGLEIEQLIDKGMFAATLYNESLKYFKSNTLNSADVDKLLSLYGAHPSFPNTPTASKTSNPDAFIANYAARRSDINDENSIYILIKKSFINLKGMVADPSSNAIAIENEKMAIRKNMEKVLAATVINYLFAIEKNLNLYKDNALDNTKALPTVNQTAAAMHAYGECVGFIWGLKNIDAAYKTIAESDITYVLSELRVPSFKTHNAYLIDKIYQDGLLRAGNVKSKLKSIYAFSDAEMEGFRNNWVSTQAR